MKPLSIKYGLGVPDHDTEGRVVTVEFDDFYLLTAYVPNSGDGLRRLVNHWYFPYSISHLRLNLKSMSYLCRLTGSQNGIHPLVTT